MLLKEKQFDIGRFSFIEVIYNSSNQPINIIEWENAGKTVKLSEDIITYAGGLVSQVVSNKYLADGSVIQALTTLPVYDNGIVQDVTTILT